MKVVNYLVLLLLVIMVADWTSPSLVFAKSLIPASCSKIKHDMVDACNNRRESCKLRTNALNQCIKKSVDRPISRTFPNKGTLCAMVYQPVCALTTKGNLQFFPSSCQSASAGATEVSLEQCQSK